jgi:hypothetical protein
MEAVAHDQCTDYCVAVTLNAAIALNRTLNAPGRADRVSQASALPVQE